MRGAVIVATALERVVQKYARVGDHDSDLIADALEDVMFEILQVMLKESLE